jgi:hypothetical protein
MNGRVYDYNLGRFLSVDPFIQDPGNSQSMNPYSYIMNNPLAGTDPSGYMASCAGQYNINCIETNTYEYRAGIGGNSSASTDNGKTKSQTTTQSQNQITSPEEFGDNKQKRSESITGDDGSSSVRVIPHTGATGNTTAFGRYVGAEKAENESAIATASAKLKKAEETLTSSSIEDNNNLVTSYGTATGYVSQDAKSLVLLRVKNAIKIVDKLTNDHFTKAIFEEGDESGYADIFAQVVPSDKLHRLQIGGKYWGAGHFVQASTVVHEISHFDNNGLSGTRNETQYATPGVRFSRDSKDDFNSAFRFEEYIMSHD